MTKIQYLLTLLEPQSDFGLWNGYTFYTILTSSGTFSGDAASNIRVDLESQDIFTYQLRSTRTIVTETIVNDTFSGYVMNINRNNTLIEPPAELPTLIPPDDLPITVTPSSPQPFQDAGKKAPINFRIYYASNLIWSVNAPEFGDSDEFSHNRELIRSRGNNLINLDVATWGKDNIYEYNFNWLSWSDAKSLLRISKNVLGKKITIIDHLGYSRLGWIINPDLEIIENVRNGFTATLRFQATYA